MDKDDEAHRSAWRRPVNRVRVQWGRFGRAAKIVWLVLAVVLTLILMVLLHEQLKALAKQQRIPVNPSKVLYVMISDVTPERMDHVIQEGGQAARPDNYISLTVLMNYVHAKLHGHQFVLVHLPRDDCSHARLGKRIWWWCRLLVIKDILDQRSDVEWLVYLDGDAYFDKVEPVPVQELLDRAKAQSRALRPARVTVERWHDSTFARPVADPHVILSKDADNWFGVCMGTNLWKNTAISRHVLCELWESPQDTVVSQFPDKSLYIADNLQRGGLGEQTVLNYILFNLFNHERQPVLKHPAAAVARSQFQSTKLSESLWLHHVAILSATFLYHGRHVHHSTKAARSPTGIVCGAQAAAKLENCILPRFLRWQTHPLVASLLNEQTVQEIHMQSLSYDRHRLESIAQTCQTS